VSRRAAIVLGVIAFLGVCFFVARWLTTEGSERSAVLTLLQTEARGDVNGVIAHLHGCAEKPACVREARQAVARTRRPGNVKILLLESQTAYALGAASGTTRVAWTIVDGGLPVVQCVDVRRTGNAVVGREIVLERLSPPINSEGSC
jgi:hypothetical protein